VRLAAEYRQRILRAMQDRPRQFEPADDPVPHGRHLCPRYPRGRGDPGLRAVKLYPAGATTNSAAGVNSLEALYPVLEVMEEVDLPLLVHGEVTEARSISSIARPSSSNSTCSPS
jgi:dihydroorotase